MADSDLFDKYFRYIKDTEPPYIYRRWSLLSGIATILGRQCWFQFGSARIFPNMYVMLVGNPGTRKSTAIKGIKQVLSATGYQNFSADKTNKEKFLMDLAGESDGKTHGFSNESSEAVTNLFGGGEGNFGEPREMFIPADEFNEFAGSGNIEFLSMLGALWDWDEPNRCYSQRLKNAKGATIYQPTINILSGNTHAGFAEAFPVAVLGQGFMSRLVLVYSEPSGRKVTIPPLPDARILESLLQDLYAIKSQCIGEIGITPHAYSALDTIYKSWPELEDPRFKHYSTRRFTHLLKLCMIWCCSNKRLAINTEDVLWANTILSYTELGMPKAMGELGRKKGSEAASKIMAKLYEAKRPIAAIELWKEVDTELESMGAMMQILQNLQTADKIQVVSIAGSKGDKGFLPKQKPIGIKNLYVDLKLLKGWEL